MEKWKLKESQNEDPLENLKEFSKNLNTTVWHVSDSVPDKDVGKQGDMCLNSITSEFYIKNSEWELSGSLRGDKGQDGHNPLTVSNEAPVDALEGDLWVNKGHLYVLFKNSWREITGASGKDGINGKEVVLKNNGSKLQWSHEGKEWHDLIDINAITGKDGEDGTDGEDGKDGEDAKEIELRKTETHIQWRRVGEKWKNLIAISSLQAKVSYNGGGGGIVVAGILEVVAGTNIVVDNTDPKRPIINAIGGGGSADWGNIGGTLSDQTDLQNALDDKANAADYVPYTGATTDINLNTRSLTTEGNVYADNFYGAGTDVGVGLEVEFGVNPSKVGGDVIVKANDGNGDDIVPGNVYIRSGLGGAVYVGDGPRYMAFDVGNVTSTRKLIMPDSDVDLSVVPNTSGVNTGDQDLSGLVPYTGASQDVDLEENKLSAVSINVTGTGGAGHVHFKHQSTTPTATGQSTVIYAQADGELGYKNDGVEAKTLSSTSYVIAMAVALG